MRCLVWGLQAEAGGFKIYRASGYEALVWGVRPEARRVQCRVVAFLTSRFVTVGVGAGKLVGSGVAVDAAAVAADSCPRVIAIWGARNATLSLKPYGCGAQAMTL